MKAPFNSKKRILYSTVVIFLFGLGRIAATTFNVTVAPGGTLTFDPFSVSIKPGDTVMWTWKGSGHSVTSGTPAKPTGEYDSGVHNTNFVFSHTYSDPGTVYYFCQPHGTCCNMIGQVVVAGETPTPTPTPTPPQPLNISTRMEVLTDAQVLIGGFIITGNDPKEVVLRAIGPSLAAFGIANPLADPVLELHASDGSLITMNDNWKDTQKAEIEASGFQPQNDLESAIISTLDPGSYTAVVSGKDGGIGVGLVEGYDLDQVADSQFGNISTRGFVETGTNVMIGGFILGGEDGNANVLIRALGPSLTAFGVSGALADPTLELRDGNGTLVRSNGNWKDTQQTEIEATGLQPTNDLESAIFETLAPGPYTAIVAGKGDTIGVGLVEVYRTH
jgi:plastocyanin